jgi:hypothetical protein
MTRLAEIRNQEMMCRERALLDTDCRDVWLAKADEWAQRAVDEIALRLRERSGTSVTGAETHRTDTAKAPSFGI